MYFCGVTHRNFQIVDFSIGEGGSLGINERSERTFHNFFETRNREKARCVGSLTTTSSFAHYIHIVFALFSTKEARGGPNI